MKLAGYVLTGAAVLGAAMISATAHAEQVRVNSQSEGIGVLEAYVGEWTARGMSRLGIDDQPETTRCTIAVAFDQGSATLTNTGRCAIGIGSADVSGTLVLNADGSLGGAFFGDLAGADLQESRGRLYAEGFVIEASYLMDRAGDGADVDVVVRASTPVRFADGNRGFSFVVEAAHPETGETVELSSFVFVQRG